MRQVTDDGYSVKATVVLCVNVALLIGKIRYCNVRLCEMVTVMPEPHIVGLKYFSTLFQSAS